MRAMIWIVVVLTVLLGGAVVADGVVRQQTEERIATEMAAGIPGVEQPPAVSIGGFPFLTQLLAGAVVADGVVRQQTEERIATEMAAGIPGVEQPPAVSIGGFPFLTQLM